MISAKYWPVSSFIRKTDLIFCVLILLLSANCVCAQTGTTSLHGVVTDKSGATVGTATVTITNDAQGLTRESATNTAGEYEFLALPPGTYVLTVNATGFQKYEQHNLQLLVNSPSTANVTLDLGTTARRWKSRRRRRP